MQKELYISIAATVIRIGAVALLYVVNIFYSSYKYNRKMQGHYESLKTTIELSSLTGLSDINDFERLFDTIKTDKIEFDESKIPDKVLEILKTDSSKKGD